MIILKTRERIIAVIAAGIVFLFLWVQFVIRPILTYRDRVNADIAAKNLKLREVNKTLSHTLQGASYNALKGYFPSGSRQEDMAKMIKEIESAAAGANLRILETKPQPLVKNTDWFELKVSIVFDGDWAQVVKFLYELESNPKPLVVNEMSLESSLPQQTSVHGRLEIGRILIDQAIN